MNTTEIKNKLEMQKSALLTKIKALNKDIRHEAKPIEKDFSEQATDAENEDVTHALFADANRELRQINLALSRIEKGEYGYCSECGEPINVKRLEVIPYAELCINCAESQSQR